MISLIKFIFEFLFIYFIKKTYFNNFYNLNILNNFNYNKHLNLIYNYLLEPFNYYLRQQASLKFFFFLYFLLQKYFKVKAKSNFIFYFKKYIKTKTSNTMYYLFLRQVKKPFIKKNAWLNKKNFFFFLLKTLLYKDAFFCLKNLIFFLSILPIFFFKKIFTWVILIFKFFKPLFFFFKVLGLYLSIRGKLGLKGGQKKRNLLYKIKKTSFSNTKLKLSYFNDMLKTKVGSIGLKLFIFY